MSEEPGVWDPAWDVRLWWSARTAASVEPVRGIVLELHLILGACNVVVRGAVERTTFQVFDRLHMLTVIGREELHPVAAEADQRLDRC